MMKLTRHLYGWQPDGRYFDYYERAHLNHAMAAQHPQNGGFTYMTPLMSGVAREFSTDKDDAFWCCVGSGMEAHAKHGESIFWQGGDTFFVNLYIPAEARWARRGAVVTLDTAYPMDGQATLSFSRLDRAGRFPLALRVPGWANGQAQVEVNGQAVTPRFERGYAVVDRRWKAGDTVSIRLPLDLRVETTPGDESVVAVLRGPMVMAADLGGREDKWDSPDPVLVGANPLAGFTAADPATARYRTAGSSVRRTSASCPFTANMTGAAPSISSASPKRGEDAGGRVPGRSDPGTRYRRALGRCHASGRDAAGARSWPDLRHLLPRLLSRAAGTRCARSGAISSSPWRCAPAQ